MGWMPCLRCGQRFHGEAENAYLTRFVGEERESYRFVCCADCLDALMSEWRSAALYRDEDGDWVYREPGDAQVRLTGPSEPRERPRTRRNGPREGRRQEARSRPSPLRKSLLMEDEYPEDLPPELAE